MLEQNAQEYEDCNLYAGNLDEETAYLMKEENTAASYTNNTAFLTIFCC